VIESNDQQIRTPTFTQVIRMLAGAVLFVCLCVVFSCNTQVKQYPSINLQEADTALIQLPKPTPLSIAETQKLQRACQLWYDSTLLPKDFSGGIIIAKKGNVVFEKYSGTKHIPGSDVITSNTPMHIASVSKTFTAMAVLSLWQNGKLNIDDEFVKYFPNFNYPGVTIRSLLNHRSGLPNYTYFLENMKWDATKIASNQDVLNFLITNKNSMGDVGPANAHFSYCNTNYALLALLIEKISGKTFANYLQHTFFTPLQMRNTFVYKNEDSLTVTPSYDWKGRYIPFNFLDAVYGDKNIYTTPQDLLIWDRALSTTDMFTKDVLAHAYAPYSNEKPGIRNYGLGWRLNVYPDGKKIIFHNGWWHGSNATFIRLLKEDATIIIIGNKFTRAIYGAKILSNLFGDYYTQEEDEDADNIKASDTLRLKPIKDSLQKTAYKKESKLQKLFTDKNKVNTQ
jgi:CubicO group peptidase (beta-lactamase class C family)